MKTFFSLSLCIVLIACHSASAQKNGTAQEFTRADKLRGSITPERAWWDLLHYKLQLEVFPEKKEITGSNTIRFKVLKPGRKMQIDLQKPLEISKVKFLGETTKADTAKELKFEREGNVYWVDFGTELKPETEQSIVVVYAGKPVVSKRPPWTLFTPASR